ncbi:DUF4919 domain-containing protein [Flavobacterium sp. Sd200]|uniref:DUF4919 domain-containing protein n=1 Tax=Flavobacterium sp. Sd200 TaxID=2692211 RepID=UPI00136B9472|nr:DUF4919 domain-containing protein [Flavobacterium sp. Sd200]MXN92940.1 DUF4919 domain-containing protein [Flavobacterium sp. Sd200]
MKKIFTILVFLMVLGANAQQTETAMPDYALIQKNISDKNSPLYFEKLYNRYKKGDSTLTTEESRHLYYGYALMPKTYDKALLSTTHASLNDILKKENPTTADLTDVIKYTAVLLEANPFSITIKKYRQYCLMQLELYKDAKIERAQTDIIIDAILSSGDGTTKQNSIHVIDATNEYELVSILGFEPVGDEYATNGQYDYFAINQNMYNLPGLYFEVSGPKTQVTGL